MCYTIEWHITVPAYSLPIFSNWMVTMSYCFEHALFYLNHNDVIKFYKLLVLSMFLECKVGFFA